MIDLETELLEKAVALADEVESLIKAAHYWKNKNPAKYKQMVSQLKSDRKKPGHKAAAQQKISQAQRRERGGKGTKAGQGRSGHASGHMNQSTGDAVKRHMTAEKKAGERLVIDRKDNKKGYASSNTRTVPHKLGIGAHKVDGKKLSAWKKKKKSLKKNLDEYGLSTDQFVSLLKSKAETDELINFIDSLEEV